MRQLPLLLTLVLVLAVSGCTSLPGNFCIPGFTCNTVVEESHDVIVIESLQALPSEVTDSGTIKLSAIVSNVANKNADITRVPVTVELYDYCEGLFSISSASGGTKISEDKERIEMTLLRGEKKQLDWTLNAAEKGRVPVDTECKLKIRAKYQYATTSITTIHLINQAEMQRMLTDGSYKKIGSYQSIGYGPIKPYINIEAEQPIPVEAGKPLNIAFTIQLVNKGNGFLSTPSGTITVNTASEPSIQHVTISTADKGDQISEDIARQLSEKIKKYINDNKAIKLVRGESAVIPHSFTVQNPKSPSIEETKTIMASIGSSEKGEAVNPYWYEFRKEVTVKVKPRI
jgi:hypothetical protein